MKLVCPSCGGVYSAEAWLNDPIARQCLRLVCELPHAVSSRCFAYLSLFRPAGAHQKSLQWKKVLRLLAELKELVTLPHVQWGKEVSRPCTPKMWGEALEKITGNPPKRLPLKSHGYLRAVVYDVANEADRKVEVKRNKEERKGNPHRRHSHEGGNPGKPERVSIETMKDIRRKNMKGKR